MKPIAALKTFAGVLTFVVAASVLTPGTASAGERRANDDGPQLSEHPKSKVYRRHHHRGPQVRGYVQRRGGYSYSYLDGEIDYRDTSILRDNQNMRRQGGPFDNGFFFDSGISRNNDSPYLN